MIVVRLPRHQTPIFPARCVGCALDDPPHTVTVWTFSSSWWVILTALAALWSKTAKASAPACSRCAWRLRFRRLAGVAYVAAVVALAVYGLKHFLPGLHPLMQRLVVAAGAAVLLLPYGLYIVGRPPAFSLEVEGDQVDYQFRDSAIGAEFLALNGGRITGLD